MNNVNWFGKELTIFLFFMKMMPLKMLKQIFRINHHQFQKVMKDQLELRN